MHRCPSPHSAAITCSASVLSHTEVYLLMFDASISFAAPDGQQKVMSVGDLHLNDLHLHKQYPPSCHPKA